jgi:5-(carboxyamino)imidazole ribonucleotide synthase
LPLSEPELLRSAIMVNILGEGKGNHLGGVEALLSDPNVVLHMYGKKHAVDRRKMGHFTMLVNGPITESEIQRARAARAVLYWTDVSPEHAATGR